MFGWGSTRSCVRLSELQNPLNMHDLFEMHEFQKNNKITPRNIIEWFSARDIFFVRIQQTKTITKKMNWI